MSPRYHGPKLGLPINRRVLSGTRQNVGDARAKTERTFSIRRQTQPDSQLAGEEVRWKSLPWAAPIDFAEPSCAKSSSPGLDVERVPAAEVNLTPYLVPHAMLRA